jgi:hypothetical protein
MITLLRSCSDWTRKQVQGDRDTEQDDYHYE